MATFHKSILTSKGNDLLARAIGGEQIEFTRLEIGSGIYDGTEILQSMDKLKNKQQEFPFLRYEKVSEESVLLVAMVSNEELPTGYRMTEIGVYGKLKGADDEIFCSITTSVAGEDDFWPPFNGVAPVRMILRYHITISQDAVPCITVSDNMVLAEIAAEANRANAAEVALSGKISVLETPEFEEAAKRENIESGEKVPFLLGKIRKWFADLKPIAFSGKYMDLSGAPMRLSEFENDSGFASTISPEFTGTPKAPTPAESDNSTRIATTAFVKAIVSALINGAPETLDTFGEIAEAFAENGAVIDALNAAIGKKLSRTEAAVSAEKWTDGRNVNGLIIDGSCNRANYGMCSTAAATAEKSISCAGFGLVVGAEITVRFMVTNTTANPTLNVNGTGAKPIYYHGVAIYAGYLAANRTYIFRYNGAQYDLVGDIDTDVRYNNMSPATASTAGRAGLVPAPGAGKQNGYLRGDATWVTPTTNLLATEPGIPLDQTMGKVLKDDLDALNSKLSSLFVEVSGTSTRTSIAALELKGFQITFPIPDGYQFHSVKSFYISGWSGLVLQGINTSKNNVVFNVYNTREATRECVVTAIINCIVNT